MNDMLQIDQEMTLRALVTISLQALSLDDQVNALVMAGWTNAQISSVTGLKPNAVNMRKARTKGKANGKEKS